MKINLSVEEVQKFSRRYKEEDSGRLLESDRSLQESLKDAHRRGHITLRQLQDVVEWKSGKRMLHLCEENTPEEIEECSKAAFAARTDRLRIHALVALHGVSWPTASAVLHFVFPCQFPVLDVRVMRAVGEIPADANQPPNYTIPLWSKYAELCRATAERYGVTLRDLDRALWMWDRCNRSQ